MTTPQPTLHYVAKWADEEVDYIINERDRLREEKQELAEALHKIAEYEDDHTTGPWPMVHALGFHIQFPNGLTLSTQFGGGNYSSNYHSRIGSTEDQSAETVELAVFKSTGDRQWLTKEISKAAGFPEQSDDVMGYVPFEDWLKIFDATRNWTAP